MFSIARCCRNKVHSTFVTKSLFSRQYMKVSDKMELLLKKSDYIPHNYNLIYRLKSNLGYRYGYHALNIITFGSIGMVGFYIYNEDVLTSHTKVSRRPGKKAVENYELCIIFLTGIGLFLIGQAIRKRCVIRIYYSEKDKMYKAIFVGKIPFTTEYCNFPEHCLTYVKKQPNSLWGNNIFYANSRKIILFIEEFRTYADFKKMLKPEES